MISIKDQVLEVYPQAWAMHIYEGSPYQIWTLPGPGCGERIGWDHSTEDNAWMDALKTIQANARSMEANKAIVLKVHPEARHMHQPQIGTIHYIGNWTNSQPFGIGESEFEAWADASKNVLTD